MNSENSMPGQPAAKRPARAWAAAALGLTLTCASSLHAQDTAASVLNQRLISTMTARSSRRNGRLYLENLVARVTAANTVGLNLNGKPASIVLPSGVELMTLERGLSSAQLKAGDTVYLLDKKDHSQLFEGVLTSVVTEIAPLTLRLEQPVNGKLAIIARTLRAEAGLLAINEFATVALPGPSGPGAAPGATTVGTVTFTHPEQAEFLRYAFPAPTAAQLPVGQVVLLDLALQPDGKTLQVARVTQVIDKS